MLKTETRDIDGVQVTCTQFVCTRALALLPRLGGSFAPLLGVLTERKLTDADVVLVCGVIAQGGSEAPAVAAEVLAGSTAVVNGHVRGLGDRAAIDAVFGGNLIALLKAVALALEVNFGSFCGALGGSAPSEAAEVAPSPSSSTRTSRKLGRPGASSAKDG